MRIYELKGVKASLAVMDEVDEMCELRFPRLGKIKMAFVQAGSLTPSGRNEIHDHFPILVGPNGVYVRIANSEDDLPDYVEVSDEG